jgi:hypothetical protein
MNATNRKIDNKADPANDPAMAALRPNNRLFSILDEIREDNPIKKPDRPHPPVADLRTTTTLDTQREELQRAIAPAAPAAAVQEIVAVTPEPVVTEPMPQPVTQQSLHTAPVLEAEAKIEITKEIVKSEPAAERLLPAHQPEPEPQISENSPVNDAAMHAESLPAKPRLRGRPRVSAEKKRESSFTLSPHMADRVRDLAAMEQLRLKRTVSASAIVERMLELAEQQIQDNRVLPS